MKTIVKEYASAVIAIMGTVSVIGVIELIIDKNGMIAEIIRMVLGGL